MSDVLIGLVSISDRASAGVYDDKGLPGLNEWFAAALKTPWRMEQRLIPDEQPVIERTLIDLVDRAGCDLVLTTGGTGPAPRDVTPEATLAVAHKVLPGFGEQMRQVSLEIRADGDPVAPGRGRARPRADHQPARAAQGDQGNARRRVSRGSLLHRPDRRTVHRNARRCVQGVPAEVGAPASGLTSSALAMTTTPFPNQPPPYEGRNLYLDRSRAAAAQSRARAPRTRTRFSPRWGDTLGRAETFALADAANRNAPQLRTHDRFGERIDDVEFHPAWHALMQLAAQTGEHNAPWTAPGPGAQVARAAMYFLHAQVENGTQCPLTMTYASVPVLARQAATAAVIADVWLPRVLARDYDPRPLPIGDKRAALIGMGMTERQGGSDVRANLTRAVPPATAPWRITGHKWFFSAPQCDAPSGARANRCRFDMLPAAAFPRRRIAQRRADRPAQGQARQPLERVVGSRIR